MAMVLHGVAIFCGYGVAMPVVGTISVMAICRGAHEGGLREHARVTLLISNQLKQTRTGKFPLDSELGVDSEIDRRPRMATLRDGRSS
jgi:hypothetical protein